ncbi:hypothetical protein QQG74_18730 [Micromonospora sp. FIMYZ51]|uniref:hypothetical protein n=1 Tax=Micromonospora sp. FIMYZ51 TaxID=3051832 RepID=UPI00312006F5
MGKIRMILRRLARSGNRIEQDRLLDAARGPRPAAGPSGPPDPLAELLRAAAAAPRPQELAGEQAALAAFRAARQTATREPAKRPRRRRFTASAVLWLAGLTATATAGAALAAAGLDHSAEPAAAPPAQETVAPGPTGGARTTTEGPTASAPADPLTDVPTDVPTDDPSASTRAEPVPDPSPVDPTAYFGPEHAGHCKAYLSKSERQRDKALRSPAFHDLVVAAGGAEQVPTRCRQLLAETDPKWLAKHGSSADAGTDGDDS